jgi:hypothetical protein
MGCGAKQGSFQSRRRSRAKLLRSHVQQHPDDEVRCGGGVVRGRRHGRGLRRPIQRDGDRATSPGGSSSCVAYWCDDFIYVNDIPRGFLAYPLSASYWCPYDRCLNSQTQMKVLRMDGFGPARRAPKGAQSQRGSTSISKLIVFLHDLFASDLLVMGRHPREACEEALTRSSSGDDWRPMSSCPPL